MIFFFLQYEVIKFWPSGKSKQIPEPDTTFQFLKMYFKHFYIKWTGFYFEQFSYNIDNTVFCNISGQSEVFKAHTWKWFTFLKVHIFLPRNSNLPKEIKFNYFLHTAPFRALCRSVASPLILLLIKVERGKKTKSILSLSHFCYCTLSDSPECSLLYENAILRLMIVNERLCRYSKRLFTWHTLEMAFPKKRGKKGWSGFL